MLLLLVSYLTSPRGPEAMQSRHWATFDSAALAHLLEQPAREALGGRICVVIGPAAPAGALALELADRPQVLIDGRYDRSPWVSRTVVDRCGALELSAGAPLPGGAAVGPAFPDLSWRALPPATVIAGSADVEPIATQRKAPDRRPKTLQIRQSAARGTANAPLS
jgi:hypothetical protein